MLIQQLYREIQTVADEKDGKLDNRVMFYGKTKEECEEKLTALVESIKAEKLVKNSPEKSQAVDVPLLAM